jgi:hypothetical protein
MLLLLKIKRKKWRLDLNLLLRQLVVEEKPQLNPTSRLVEEEELQQLFVEGQPQLVHVSRPIEEKEL